MGPRETVEVINHKNITIPQKKLENWDGGEAQILKNKKAELVPVYM